MISGRRKLLIADDSPTIQKVINLTFEDEDIEVVAVSDGQQALRILEERTPPDILLADIWMPGPNGYELCERVKRDARLRHIPVILLVGAFEPFNEAEARRVGADTVLTKPFQSIRDLVSKVGSLLGGESKKEDETHAQNARADKSADEAMTLQADVPMHHVEANAQASESSADSGNQSGQHDAAPSFGDFGADDELIEAKPADSFGLNATEAGSSREDFHAVAQQPSHEPNLMHEQVAAPAQEQASALAQEQTFASTQEQSFAPHAFSESNFEAHAQDTAESAPAAPRSFAARASAAMSADDALLDLGQFDAPASTGADVEDDFVLDIDLDEPAPSTRWRNADAAAQPDAPSALAEASHGGGSDAAFKEATAPFNKSVSPSNESASAFERTEHASAARVETVEETPAEVVMQDEPQPMSAHEASFAPRGFVEPSVVPADAPAPAAFESAFTDGSVEGDVAKAPVSDYKTQPVGDEPTPAGFAVGEARAGLDAPLRADNLSPEAIDKIARRVVELMSDKVVREIAWEVVPDLAELLIKQRLDEEKK